jgi:hypothetical protein
MRKNKFIFIYSLVLEQGIKNFDLILFSQLRIFYQRQSWNYSSSNIHWRQSQEYYKQIIIA